MALGHWLKDYIGPHSGGSGGGGTLVARATLDTRKKKLILDKTFKEISDAYFAGQVVKVIEPGDGVSVWDVLEPNTKKMELDLYQITPVLDNANIVLGNRYSATSEDSYPSEIVVH